MNIIKSKFHKIGRLNFFCCSLLVCIMGILISTFIKRKNNAITGGKTK